MKTLLCVLSCALTIVRSMPTATNETELTAEWEDFKKEYHKIYATDEMEFLRKLIFQENKKKIDAHNELLARGYFSYSKGVNQFTDLLESEFELLYLGLLRHTHSFNGSDNYVSDEENNLDYQAPESVDWRNSAVTRVKNQLQCGSCWAFSVTGAIEGQAALRLGKRIELSEQQLVDCVYGESSGCKGGSTKDAYSYIKKAGGIESEYHYPYTSQSGSCKFLKSESEVKVTGYKRVSDNEDSLRNAVAAIGPISVSIAATRIQHYSHGIYDDPNCGTYLNHAMLVVGYGTEKGVPYWLVKNSWGTTWGEEGYIRMRRDRGNQCGIATVASYPLVANEVEDKDDDYLVNLNYDQYI